MLRTAGLKLLYLVPVLFVVSLGTFFMLELVPGDPAVAVLGADATPAQIDFVREELGLDKPVFERYAAWLGDAVRGDLGKSLLRPANSVTDLVRQALPFTLQLAFMALLMALIVAIPLAMATAYRPGGPLDRVVGSMASALISIPSFLAALILIYFFVFHPQIPRYTFFAAGMAVVLWLLWKAAGRLRERIPKEALSFVAGAVVVAVLVVLITNFWPQWPRVGMSRITSEAGLRENLRSAFLPALVLSLTEIAVFTRLLHTDLTATLQDDYILAARAKGMPTWRIVARDALRPSSFSLITLAGVSLGRLIGGTVIIESVFGIQGMGRMVVGSITANDFTIVQGGVLVIAAAYVIINLFVDISYAALDPRIRRGRQ